MRCAAAIVVVSVAFASQALAVLRPLFPAKAAPPFNGELIMIGNDSIQHPANKAPATAPR
jgi:predicted secreted protein